MATSKFVKTPQRYFSNGIILGWAKDYRTLRDFSKSIEGLDYIIEQINNVLYTDMLDVDCIVPEIFNGRWYLVLRYYGLPQFPEKSYLAKELRRYDKMDSEVEIESQDFDFRDFSSEGEEKNFLQKAFSLLGWNTFDVFQREGVLNSLFMQAFKNACLQVNHGCGTTSIPSAEDIFGHYHRLKLRRAMGW